MFWLVNTQSVIFKLIVGMRFSKTNLFYRKALFESNQMFWKDIEVKLVKVTSSLIYNIVYDFEPLNESETD